MTKLLLTCLLFCLYTAVWAQKTQESITFGLGYGNLIQADDEVFDFHAAKYGFRYLRESPHLAMQFGYSNWQSVSSTQLLTQNSLETAFGYHYRNQLGAVNGLLGTTLRYVYGADPALFQKWSLGLLATVNSRFYINKKLSFLNELELVYNGRSYNSISFMLGLTFNLK